jgi:glycosyltransferase involved in cell wall biosynthesis
MKPKLRIAVNTRLLLRDRLEGIGYFTYEMLLRITRAHPEVEFHFLFDRAYDECFIFGDNVKPVVLFPQARHPFLWYWWFEWSVAGYLKKHQFDLFLSPDGYVSLRSDTPTLAVQHDIAFEHYPDYVSGLTSRYYKYYVPKFVSHATRVATVSEFSKADIVKQYGTSPDKIDVVYSAAKDIFQPISLEEKVRIADRYTEGKPYLIYVGSIHPRKNLKNMLLAFDEFKKANQSSTLKFLVVGAFGWQNSDLKPVMDQMQYRDEVVFLGRQPLAELADLIAASYALLYLSIFEGFGVPPLEGMKCGVPVITSNISSIPEICGDAALLVDPTDVNAITQAITQLWTDHVLYQNLINKGTEQAKKYTWDICAELLWSSCLKAMSQSKT